MVLQRKFSLDEDVVQRGNDEGAAFILDERSSQAEMKDTLAQATVNPIQVSNTTLGSDKQKERPKSANPRETKRGPMKFFVVLSNFVSRNISFDCTTHMIPYLTVRFAVDDGNKASKKFFAKADEIQEVGNVHNVNFAHDKFSFTWSCKDLADSSTPRLVTNF
jgi:hypothetical protein